MYTDFLPRSPLTVNEGCRTKNSVESQRNRCAYDEFWFLIPVPVEAQVVSSIGQGLCVLVGVGTGLISKD